MVYLSCTRKEFILLKHYFKPIIQRNMKHSLLSCLALLLFNTIVVCQTNLNYRFSYWYNNKQAAIAITFDDGFAIQFSGYAPELNKRNIKGTFFIMSSTANWDSIRSLASRGHEIGNHGVSDKNWATELKNKTITRAQINNEMISSKTAIETQIGNGYICNSLAWPQGGGGGAKTDTSQVAVRHLAMNHFYIGARNANGGPDAYTKYTNTWFENYWYQIGSFNADAASPTSFGTNIRSNISQRGLLIFFTHQTLLSNTLGQMMDTMISYNNHWINTFGNISKYHHEVIFSTLSEISESDTTWKLRLTDTNTKNNVFNHPITIRAQKPSWAIDSIKQGSSKITFIEELDTIQFNAIPDGGDITFYKATGVGITYLKVRCNELSIKENPCKSSSTIEYSVSKKSQVKISILNVLGNTLTIPLNRFTNEGQHSLVIDCGILNSGLYYVVLETTGERIVKKIIVK